MRPRTVLGLALVVAALGAFVFFYERDLPSSEERRATANRLLRPGGEPLDPEAVEAVTLEWQGRRLRLERRAAGDGGDGWRLAEPTAARADGSQVRAFLDELAGLDAGRTLDGDEGDAAGQGLEPPRGRLVVAAAGGESALEIGAAVPLTGSVLVRRPGERAVHVADGGFVRHLERPPEDWRDRRVLPFPSDRIERISLRAPGGAGAPVVLERRDGRFRLAGPVEDLAAAERVDQLLTELSSLRAEAYLGERVPPDPEVVVELGAGEESVRLEIAPPPADGDGLHRIRVRTERGGEESAETVSAAAAVLADTVVAALAEPAAWRSRDWTALESYEVAGVEIDSADGETNLVRAGADWRRDGEPIPFTEVSDLLLAVTGATAEGFLPPADDGEPTLVLRLRRDDGATETLTLHPPRTPDAAVRPARTSARPGVVLALPAGTAEEVQKALAAVREAEPLPESEDVE